MSVQDGSTFMFDYKKQHVLSINPYLKRIIFKMIIIDTV